MYTRKVPDHGALLFCVVLFAALPLSIGMTDVDACSDSSCAEAGTALLHAKSSTQKVVFSQQDADARQQDRIAYVQTSRSNRAHAASLDDSDSMPSEPVAFVQASRSYSTQSARVEAKDMGGLAYDSNDDAGSIRRSLASLEFDDETEFGADAFHKAVESTGYSESSDASFSPNVWNNHEEIRNSHNCYMYALNDLSPRSAEQCKRTLKLVDEGRIESTKRDRPKVCKAYFHKPGYFFQNVASGRDFTDVWNREETTCHLMNPMLAADSPAIVWRNEHNTSLTEEDSCPKNHYMAALFIQPKAGFHFYRRDHACADDPKQLCWSHKPGILNATTKDASGHVIPSVMKANRDYGGLNYTHLCSLFCVPENAEARSHSDARKGSLHKSSLLKKA